ncbi:hypothetical protein [Aquibacillus kalidii]|uniref:hypothetical protein n=1 Tax=Aquibacillus kalidii TaxID=2762597 RepID=UPI001645264D|nr:hypothetical protein [Aquibacillus kalidii]
MSKEIQIIYYLDNGQIIVREEKALSMGLAESIALRGNDYIRFCDVDDIYHMIDPNKITNITFERLMSLT